MSLLGTFFRRVGFGRALNKLASLYNLTRVFNVLEDIQGVNCRIEKPVDAEGRGWRIIVDGSGDEAPPDGKPPPWSSSAVHFGDTADAKEQTDWKQSSEKPAVLRIGGQEKVDVLVDSMGNVVAWTTGSGGGDPADPAAVPPPCGNPLNVADDSNPLDDPREGAGGGNDGANIPDSNPLDYEGAGGFTPKCGDLAA